MSTNGKETRSRAPNFTYQDQLLLFDAIKPYAHIIEAKQTDSVKQIDKHNAWKKISEVFNSNAIGQHRSTDNLISCYRNFKTKLKKQHSQAKMLLVDPEQKESLLNAMEENGQDWTKVALSSNWQDPNLCQQGFEVLKKELKKDDTKTKKHIMGTGGGPCIQEAEKDNFSILKKIIKPQVDGLFTIYDSDAKIMEQYNKSIAEEERVRPIDGPLEECLENKQDCLGVSEETNTHEHILKTPKIQSRTQILRKKKEPALCLNEPSKKTSVNDSFKQLSEAKLELVQLQTKKLLAEMQHIEKQQLLENNYKELELENFKKEIKFKELMREKELQLIDIKIDKAKNT